MTELDEVCSLRDPLASRRHRHQTTGWRRGVECSRAISAWTRSNKAAGLPIQADATLSPDLESSREQFATCCRPRGNREGPTFHSVNIGRTESRPRVKVCAIGA
jgi:hypothetical protein